MKNRYPLKAMVALFVLAYGSVFAQTPAAPSDLIAQSSVQGDMAISLFWTDNSSDEIGFEIQRMEANSPLGFQTVRTIMTPNIGSANDVGLNENTTYIYRVRAIGATSVSDFSNTASAATSYLMPAQITNLQAAYSAGAVNITWTDNATNETHFDVERAEDGVSTAFEVIATLGPNSTSYVDTTTLTGTSYTYRIRPWRFTTFTGAPDTVTVATGTGLPAMQNVSARRKTMTSIELNWRTGYPVGHRTMIQRFDLNTGLWVTIAQVNANWGRYTDTGLQRNTSYFYRLRIMNPTSVSPSPRSLVRLVDKFH